MVAPAPRWTWGYVTGGKRDLRLDFLRGYALLVMIVNHTVVADSWLYLLSGREGFYTSAAEAFYFISGLVLGIIAVRQPLEVAVRRVLRRTWVLYRAAVVLALGFAALGWLTDLRLWYDVQQELPHSRSGIQEFIAGTLTLHTSFHGAQILVLYVLFMLVTPLALIACARGRGWLVLLVSGMLYAISQFFPDVVGLPFAVYPTIAAWQPIFFGGLVIGYHRDWLARVIDRIPGRRALIAGLMLASAFFLYVYIRDYAPLPGLPDRLGEREPEMRWVRLAIIALFFQSIYLLVSWFWRPLRVGLGWLLIPLGQASLWSFCAHLIVIVILYNLPAFDPEGSRWQGTSWHVLALLVIWASVQARRLAPAIRSRRPSMSSMRQNVAPER